MNEQYVEERIRQYSAIRIVYEEFAEQVLNILQTIIKHDYPTIKIAAYSKRAKEIESLRKKLRKDKYNENSEITDLAGVRVITYSRKDISIIADIVEKSFEVDLPNSIDKSSSLGSDRVGYRGKHYVVLFDQDRLHMPENRRFADLKCEFRLQVSLRTLGRRSPMKRVISLKVSCPGSWSEGRIYWRECWSLRIWRWMDMWRPLTDMWPRWSGKSSEDA